MESFTEKRDGRSKQEKIPEISGHKKTFPATAGNVRIKKKKMVRSRGLEPRTQ